MSHVELVHHSQTNKKASSSRHALSIHAPKTGGEERELDGVFRAGRAFSFQFMQCSAFAVGEAKVMQ